MTSICSFNNIRFYARAITDQGYNNQVVMHDVAKGKHGPVIEVMGRGAEIYEVEGFVDFEQNTFMTMNELRQMVMKKGTGTFMHPTLGLKQCAVMSFATMMDGQQYNICNIRITLVVVNNQYYNIGTSAAHGLMALVQRASSVMSSFDVSGLGGSALSVLGAGEGIIKSISGFDPVLNVMGNTLGRFYQAGQMGSSILNNASTLTDAVPLVENKLSTVTSQLKD